MHDVGMNMQQLSTGIGQVRDVIELARGWSGELADACASNQMDRTARRLSAAATALDEAVAALANADQAIEDDHNDYGGASVELV